MLLFALFGTVLGATLGGLSIAAIIPAVLLVLVVAGIVGTVGDGALGPQILDVGLLVVCLQLGYFIGAGLRFASIRKLEQSARLLLSRRP
jgi:hypothetical protein